jgi:fructuronate reductase
VPCDNVPSNGSATARVVGELAAAVDESLPGWLAENVSFVTTMVDRITPRTTDEDVRSVREATGVDDAAPVVTEPFSEWVISGAFPAGRPRWEDAGATFTDDATPFEQRKLWLLNGAHSLLAYAGSARGHATTTEAIADPWCRAAVEQWWDEAAPYIALPADDLTAYRSALLGRWANPRIRHHLAQIAEDGSAKVPVRILPVLRAEREAGRLPEGATRVLAAWIAHLRGAGAPVVDARAEQVTALAAGDLPSAVRAVLAELDPVLAADDEVLGAVVRQAGEIAAMG